MQDEPPNETLAVVAPVEVAVTEVGPLGSVWKAEAEGTKRIEDAAIDNTTRTRNDFFTYGYPGLFSFQTEKHPEGDDPEPVISKAQSLRI